MTYTELALVAATLAVAADLWLLRTRLVRRRVFWAAYLIVLFFQLITNGLLTGLGVVHYDGGAIVGGDVPIGAVPPAIPSGSTRHILPEPESYSGQNSDDLVGCTGIGQRPIWLHGKGLGGTPAPGRGVGTAHAPMKGRRAVTDKEQDG